MRNVLVRNPVMEWICHLTGKQRIGVLIGFFALGAFSQVLAFFQGGQLPILVFLILVPVGWGMMNIMFYLILSFQVHWKQTVRNRIATIFSFVTLLIFVLVLVYIFLFFSSPSGTPKPVMESSSSDGSCTIQIYTTDFSLWEGYDGEVYVEWSDRPGEKELIMEIENSYQMQISWYGNERVTVNGQTFFIEDREIHQSTS